MKKILIFSTLILSLVYAISETRPSIAQVAPKFPTTPPALKLNDPLPGNLFVELGKAINPAVVNISTSVNTRGRGYRDPMLDMLEQFYGMPLQPRGGGGSGKPQRMGLGTGFIIREDGLIVTNNHVIQGADIIEVQLTENSDKQYRAEIIGSDERTDIALIKIKPDIKLTTAVLGSSEDLQVGEWVAAFGNPYGHGHSMTKGIISSKGREIGEINRLPLIQTDASINPGNSGGPLVNSKGLVVGVNSAIDARAQGIGFAIPIDEVKKIIPQLETRGSLQKGYLGVALGDIDNQAAAEMGMEEYRGAVVMRVEDGPAKKAGLKVYDLVTEFNGKKIRFSRDLMDRVAATTPGDKIKLKVLRGDKDVNIDVIIAERPDEKSLSRKFKEEIAPNAKKSSTDLGLEIADLNQQLRDAYNLDKDVQRPIIVGVEKGSIGNRIGLQIGDVILSINKVDPKTAKEALSAFKKGTNSIRVARGQGMSSITFDMP